MSLIPHSQSELEPRLQPRGSQDIYSNQIPPLPSPHDPKSSLSLWCLPFLLLLICHDPSSPAPPFSPPPLPATASTFSSSLSSTSALKVSGFEKQGSSNSKQPIGILSLLPPTAPHRRCPKNLREVGKKEAEMHRDPERPFLEEGSGRGL